MSYDSQLSSLLEMGIAYEDASKALQLTKGNLESAINLIFSNDLDTVEINNTFESNTTNGIDTRKDTPSKLTTSENYSTSSSNYPIITKTDAIDTNSNNSHNDTNPFRNENILPNIQDSKPITKMESGNKMNNTGKKGNVNTKPVNTGNILSKEKFNVNDGENFNDIDKSGNSIKGKFDNLTHETITPLRQEENVNINYGDNANFDMIQEEKFDETSKLLPQYSDIDLTNSSNSIESFHSSTNDQNFNYYQINDKNNFINDSNTTSSNSNSDELITGNLVLKSDYPLLLKPNDSNNNSIWENYIASYIITVINFLPRFFLPNILQIDSNEVKPYTNLNYSIDWIMQNDQDFLQNLQRLICLNTLGERNLIPINFFINNFINNNSNLQKVLQNNDKLNDILPTLINTFITILNQIKIDLGNVTTTNDKEFNFMENPFISTALYKPSNMDNLRETFILLFHFPNDEFDQTLYKMFNNLLFAELSEFNLDLPLFKDEFNLNNVIKNYFHSIIIEDNNLESSNIDHLELIHDKIVHWANEFIETHKNLQIELDFIEPEQPINSLKTISPFLTIILNEVDMDIDSSNSDNDDNNNNNNNDNNNQGTIIPIEFYSQLYLDKTIKGLINKILQMRKHIILTMNDILQKINNLKNFQGTDISAILNSSIEFLQTETNNVNLSRFNLPETSQQLIQLERQIDFKRHILISWYKQLNNFLISDINLDQPDITPFIMTKLNDMDINMQPFKLVHVTFGPNLYFIRDTITDKWLEVRNQTSSNGNSQLIINDKLMDMDIVRIVSNYTNKKLYDLGNPIMLNYCQDNVLKANNLLELRTLLSDDVGFTDFANSDNKRL